MLIGIIMLLLLMPVQVYAESSCVGCMSSAAAAREVVLIPPSFGITWIVPENPTELFDKAAYRTMTDTVGYGLVNLRANMVRPGPTGSTIRLEYQNAEGGWSLFSSAVLSIDETGFSQTGYIPITSDAKKEGCLIRIVAEGGDGETKAIFSSIAMEIK